MRYLLLTSLVLLMPALYAHESPEPKSAFPTQVIPAPTPAPAQPAPKEGAVPAPAPTPAETLESVMLRLNPRQKIAQLMLITMQGQHAPRVEDMAMLQKYTPGAIVIPHLLQPASAANYVTKIRAAEAGTGIPLLVGANLYEVVRRERGAASAFAQLPTLLSLAAANDSEATAATADLVAQHMKTMGFNFYVGPSFALAPTLAGVRGSIDSFGSDPLFVSMAGWTFCEKLQSSGVVPMPLGFPGGGANRTEKKPAVLLTPRNLVYEQDLRPYVHAVAQDAPLINVGNTYAPTLDDVSRPASVSPQIMKTLLRGQLEYKGIIVAGPLDSNDVTAMHEPAEAALLALNAGADMIYLSGQGNLVMRVVDKLVNAVDEGQLPAATVDIALRRVLSFKQAWAAEQREPVTERAVTKLEPGRGMRADVYEIERKAITLVQNRGQVLPLSKERGYPVQVSAVVGGDTLVASLEKHFKPISQQVIATAQQAGEIHDFEIERVTSHVRGIKTIIVVFTDRLRKQGQVELVSSLKAAGVNVVVVLLGYPVNLTHLAMADAILLAYCDSATYDETLKAVADTIAGEGALTIAVPQAEVKVKAGEERLYNIADLVRVPAGQLPVTLNETYRAGLAVSYALDDAVKKVEWDFGDGKKAKEPKSRHTFTAAGKYPISLTVTDAQGTSTTRTLHMTVE